LLGTVGQIYTNESATFMSTK